MKISQTAFIILLLASLLILGYGHTLSFPFLFDDHWNITDNISIQISSFNLQDILNAINESYRTRPLTTLSLALNHIFGQLNPVGFRLINIIVHFLNGVLVFFLLKKTFNLTQPGIHKQSLAPFFGALLWFVHPIQIQAVTYIIQRSTILATFFILVSLLLYIEAQTTPQQGKKFILYTLCIISGLLAISSKEIAITLPLIIVLYNSIFLKKNKKLHPKSIFFALFAFLSIILLILLSLETSPIQLIKESYLTRSFTLTERLLTEPRVILLYLSLLFFPYYKRFNFDYDFPISTGLFSPPQTIIAIILLTSLFFSAIKLKKKQPILSFAIFWFFINLALESSVIGLEIIFEHRLYLPSIFIFFALIVWLEIININKKILIVFLSFFVIILAIWTHQRNLVWSTPISFWQDAVKKSPLKSRPVGFLGREYLLVGDYNNAMLALQKAVTIDPNNFEARNSLGVTMSKVGKSDEAKELLYQNIQLAPDYIASKHNLALIYSTEGNTKEAIKIYTHILEQFPKTIQAYFDLANILIETDRQKAISLLDQLEIICNNHSAILKQIGDFYFSHKMYSKAQEYYTSTLAINNNQPAVHNALGGIYFSKGELQNAQQQFFTAVKQEPTYDEAKKNLAATIYNIEQMNKNGSQPKTK